jgi:hypothetical protein
VQEGWFRTKVLEPGGLAGCKATPVKRLLIILMAVASAGISAKADHTFRWHRHTDNSLLLDDDQYGVCYAHKSYTLST